MGEVDPPDWDQISEMLPVQDNEDEENKRRFALFTLGSSCSQIIRLKTNKSGESKERRQNYFVDLPPTPLAENHFGKKTLAEENRQNFPK